MNAIWSGSHLHVKTGKNGGKSTQSSIPSYDYTVHQTVASHSPPQTHHQHHHRHEKDYSDRLSQKHNKQCAVHKKEKRAKSHDEINKLKVSTPETVRQSNSSLGIHSCGHFVTPELPRKISCQVHQTKKKSASDANKYSPHISKAFLPPRLASLEQKYDKSKEKPADKDIYQRSYNEISEDFFAHRNNQNSIATHSGPDAQTNSTTSGPKSYILKETSV